jgi:tetratricopeptide (TPR) repeat protein
MIYILCTIENEQAMKDAVYQNELAGEVMIATRPAERTDLIVDDLICVRPAWDNKTPPLLFPPCPYTPENLVGLLFTRLGNYSRASVLLQKSVDLQWVPDNMDRLSQHLRPTLPDKEILDYPGLHNKAVLLHYGILDETSHLETLKRSYAAAIAAAEDAEQRAFTIRQFATLLIDAESFSEAEFLLELALREDLPPVAAMDLKSALCTIYVKQLHWSNSPGVMERAKATLAECLHYYKHLDQRYDMAMLYYEAAFVAQTDNQLSEALGHITKAINLYDEEGFTEMKAQAQLRKGRILQAWARKGSPQFYRSAAEAFQQALTVFDRDSAPDVFADIHHQLGIIYAEIPEELKKKGLWASISVASFQEALDYFNKVDYPYSFASICNNLGLAYTRFPQPSQGDNFEKALNWYREALDVFEASAFPKERAATLHNYIEAAWQAGNKAGFEAQRYSDLLAKTTEILAIGAEAGLLTSARKYLSKLKEWYDRTSQPADHQYSN